MIIFQGWVQISFLILIGVLAFKTMIGFHWPWEKCECCGKKYKDHKRKDSSWLPINFEEERKRIKKEIEREKEKKVND